MYILLPRTKLPALFFATVVVYVVLPMKVESSSSSSSRTNAVTEIIQPAAPDPPTSKPAISSLAPSSQPTMHPSFSIPNTKETKFRQEFLTGNRRFFDTDDIFVFEALYMRYTNEYSPLPTREVEFKIETSCKVNKQIFLSADTPNNKLIVDYTMKYYSQHYNVTNYPKLFQNWINSNLDILLAQMQSLKLNATRVDSAKRILVATQAPTTASFAPSMDPTSFPSTPSVPTIEVWDEPIDFPDTTVIPGIVAEPEPEPNGSNEFMIHVGVSLVFSVSILAMAVFFYHRKRGSGPESRGSKTTTREYGKSHPERGGSRTDDVESNRRSCRPLEDDESGKKERTENQPSAFGTLETIIID